MSTKSIPLPSKVIHVRFVSREKRFIIKAIAQDRPVTMHTNNSGSMLGLLRPERRLLASVSDNPKRKLPYTLELVRNDDFWVGVNTQTPNKMLKLCWKNRLIPELEEFTHFKAEAGSGQSRIDARLEGPSGVMWIEAKNVTLVEDERACFPDAISTRAAKHMKELTSLARSGHRVACFYLVQRPDCKCFGPADFIDPEFARAMYDAVSHGLEVLAFKTEISETAITLGSRLSLKW
ncbi:DNA/RNA nuclease SfsA [Desulfonatronovibrio magnus]|uniref:DNA/RNA nuclease SfsA n=1 Tax=Desulfonatronovibrio magnus TaxID=698827 RepID=UPI0005EBAA56|nr:DNA/RNA nuclease SfsA [Desulfonatronovibrio magnus]